MINVNNVKDYSSISNAVYLPFNINMLQTTMLNYCQSNHCIDIHQHKRFSFSRMYNMVFERFIVLRHSFIYLISMQGNNLIYDHKIRSYVVLEDVIKHVDK